MFLMNENVMLPGVLWWLLKFGSACWSQSLAMQGMTAYNLVLLAVWLGGLPFQLAMSNVWWIGGNIKV